MFSIKIGRSCISLLVFQINIYNSEEYVSDSYTTYLSFIKGSTNSYVPQIIEIQFFDLYLQFLEIYKVFLSSPEQ